MAEGRIRKYIGIVLLVVSSCAILLSQSARSPTFEVASVRRVNGKPGDPGFRVTVRGGPGTSDPGRVIYTNQNLLSMVSYAYNQYVDATTPAWIGTEHYDIEAKIPPGTTVAEFHLMLRNLLAERFHMVVHHETREYDGYDLLVAKGGLKMKKSSEEDLAAADRTAAEQLASGPLLSAGLDAKGYPQLLRPGITTVQLKNSIAALHLMARAQTLSELIEVLKNLLNSPIVDKTGLSGRYDCTLDFHFGAPMMGMEPNDLIPYIPLAVDALGLKMVSVKVPVDTVIIDSADRIPTEN
jgi:uncharacterized protein (TIGR03435 family)